MVTSVFDNFFLHELSVFKRNCEGGDEVGQRNNHLEDDIVFYNLPEVRPKQSSRLCVKRQNY